MQLKRREEGIALVAAILTMLVVMGLVTLMFARSLNEIKTTRDSVEITRTLLLARGAANLGVAMLNDPVKAEVDIAVANSSSSSSRWAYDPAASNSSTVPNPRNVATNLLAQVTTTLQTRADAYACNTNNYGAMKGSVAVRIYFTNTACGVALPSSVSLPAGRYYDGEGRNSFNLGKQAYAVPYVLVAEGFEGKYKRNVVIQGEYVFEIGRSSFARFAYFTNTEAASDGGLIFFTDQTLIDGPVHTNGHFAFAYDPWFGGAVTSNGCGSPDPKGKECPSNITPVGGAFFRETYCRTTNNNGTCNTYATRNSGVTKENMRPNDQAPSLGGTAPILAGGAAWDAKYIPLPQNSNDQQKIAQGFNTDGSQRPDIGINISGNLTSLEMRTIDAYGNSPTLKNGEWTPRATYQTIKTCTSASSCTLYVVDKDKRMYTCQITNKRSESDCLSNTSNFSLLPKPFNGVIHVSGNIDSLTGPTRTKADKPETAAPAIAAFSQVTVAATGQVRLTGDLKYEERPVKGQPERNENDRTVTPAEYVNPEATNVLGIYSSQNNIVVGNNNSQANLNAPNDIEVDSILMSGQGSIAVENYDLGTSKGKFKLLGGMIQNRRGAFGTFSGAGGGGTGFNRVYTYDKRMQDGLSPPFFPTTGQDKVNWVRATAYGQREQVY